MFNAGQMVQLTHTSMIAKPTWLQRHPSVRRGAVAALLSCSILVGHTSAAALVCAFSLLLQCIAAALLTRHAGAFALMAALVVPVALYWPQQALVVDHCALYALSMGIMLFVFAHSLLPSRQPLIAVAASRVHGPLRADVALYTHALTIFWTVFFAAALLTPALLFWLGPQGTWCWPQSGGTFAAALTLMLLEAGVRRIVIRNFKHASLRTTVTAFCSARAAANRTTTSDA